jgi:hypothetical protein
MTGLPALGAPYTRKPVTVYSAGTANIIAARVSHYQVFQDSIRGMFTARADLAACLLAQLADNRYVRKTVGVVTTVGTPGIPRQIWHEGIKKEEKS